MSTVLFWLSWRGLLAVKLLKRMCFCVCLCVCRSYTGWIVPFWLSSRGISLSLLESFHWLTHTQLTQIYSTFTASCHSVIKKRMICGFCSILWLEYVMKHFFEDTIVFSVLLWTVVVVGKEWCLCVWRAIHLVNITMLLTGDRAAGRAFGNDSVTERHKHTHTHTNTHLFFVGLP